MNTYEISALVIVGMVLYVLAIVAIDKIATKYFGQ